MDSATPSFNLHDDNNDEDVYEIPVESNSLDPQSFHKSRENSLKLPKRSSNQDQLDAKRKKYNSNSNNFVNELDHKDKIFKATGGLSKTKGTKFRSRNSIANQTLITTFFQQQNPASKKNSPTAKSSTNSSSSCINKPMNLETLRPEPQNLTQCKSLRKCPFYKIIPGTTFAVDAFSYGCIPSINSYFLSHFHYDHYAGLTHEFHHNIYCSKITANLIDLKIRVNKKYIKVLPLYKPCIVDNVSVILLNAEHCPGAVMFLFRLPKDKAGHVFLHTGDFRASPKMERFPQLKCHINKLYLDTTYCDPSYDFPPQATVLSKIVSVVKKELNAHSDTLIICGSYTIGKEKVFLSIAEAIDSKIAAHSDKLRILQCLEDQAITNRLTPNWLMAQVHVLPMGQLKHQTLMKHLEKYKTKFSRILAVKPTGWTFDSKMSKNSEFDIEVKNRGSILMCELSYSEHSSFSEMRRFVQFVHPDKIIPTVNVGSKASRDKMESLFQKWLGETGVS